MREAKGHSLFIFRRREELKERRSSLLEEATIFQFDCWRDFSEQGGEDCIYYFVCTEPEKSTTCVFFLLYGCFIYCTVREVYGLFISAVRCIKLAQISRGVRPVLYCCTVHLIFAQISRKVRLGFFLYGLLINCTDFEERVRPVCCCTDCFYWHKFLENVRPVGAVLLHLIWHRKEEWVYGWFAEHISRLWDKVCRWR